MYRPSAGLSDLDAERHLRRRGDRRQLYEYPRPDLGPQLRSERCGGDRRRAAVESQAVQPGSVQHPADRSAEGRSEEHTSELQSLMRISYAVFCLKKKNKTDEAHNIYTQLT